MDENRASEVLNSWRRILVEGPPDKIGLFLTEVEERLGKDGFLREPVAERRLNWNPERRNTFFCFLGGPQGGPKLLLCLNRVSDRKVRGATCSFIEGPDASRVQAAEVIERVIDKILVPASHSFGLEVTRPRLGPLSVVPPRTEAALGAFTDLAGGALPLSQAEEAAWRKFLITAGQEDVAFDSDELQDWFVTNGWSPEGARALIERFVREATLLSEYSEATGA